MLIMIPKSKTILIQNIKLYVPSRTFFKLTLKVTSNVTTHSSLPPRSSTMSLQRNSYRVSAGKVVSPMPKVQPANNTDNSTTVQSDMTGGHKIAIVKTCPDQKQCHKRNCDTTHENVCPYEKDDSVLLIEVSGALTHKIPQGKQGTKVDDVDAKGNASPQYIVRENTALPITNKNFNENEAMTEYVQRKDIAQKIVENLPENSVFMLKNTSNVDTALDND